MPPEMVECLEVFARIVEPLRRIFSSGSFSRQRDFQIIGMLHFFDPVACMIAHRVARILAFEQKTLVPVECQIAASCCGTVSQSEGGAHPWLAPSFLEGLWDPGSIAARSIDSSPRRVS